MPYFAFPRRQIQQVLEALYFLHHLQPPIAHRDIKTENLVVVDEGNWELKLIDLGLSKSFRRVQLRGGGAEGREAEA